MPARERVEKTLDKMRRGGLPAPTADKPSIETGSGNRCSGCDETIEPTEMLYAVRVVVPLRFHDVCYNAWATFKRS